MNLAHDSKISNTRAANILALPFARRDRFIEIQKTRIARGIVPTQQDHEFFEANKKREFLVRPTERLDHWTSATEGLSVDKLITIVCRDPLSVWILRRDESQYGPVINNDFYARWRIEEFREMLRAGEIPDDEIGMPSWWVP
jgi:hypothetical protein